MSVDTNVKGKNLQAYRKLRHDEYQILITPTLVGLVESMRVTTKGRFARSLMVEFSPTERASDDCC
ncbi:MAG: hypothetical protein QNM02_01800 [Acidimicrobiia bacterium]|nr:hypothetical protein [Acidimicrobiia bacterium]